MTTLLLAYPCVTLATRIDPLALALQTCEECPDSRLVEALAREKVRDLLRACGVPEAREDSGRADHAWYWVAPALMDARWHPQALEWAAPDGRWQGLDAAEEGDEGRSEDHTEQLRFADHLRRFVSAPSLVGELGPPPSDLAETLALLALAGPGICALRALRRVTAASLPADLLELMCGAARISSGFVSLFNGPDAMGLLEQEGARGPYWRQVLEYGLDGNLQAVLDEYLHVLRDGLGLLGDRPAAEVIGSTSRTVRSVLSIRTPTLAVDELRISAAERKIATEPFRIRCSFALRYGEIKDDTGKTLARAGTVREAFNSPFRPFVLATTSIGQEGLDFHPYCHVVYHWNLPSNPVDLEQREGRVHRYKGHAIRKNVARRHGLAALKTRQDGEFDPWEALFDAAAKTRPIGASELVPYWLYEVEGGAKVERRVPLLPFSREEIHLERLKRSLALYRLVFGQPRQEDLLNYLDRHLGERPSAAALDEWRISLAPPSDEE
jgi:hypothetical protein